MLLALCVFEKAKSHHAVRMRTTTQNKWFTTAVRTGSIVYCSIVVVYAVLKYYGISAFQLLLTFP